MLMVVGFSVHWHISVFGVYIGLAFGCFEGVNGRVVWHQINTISVNDTQIQVSRRRYDLCHGINNCIFAKHKLYTMFGQNTAAQS